MDIESEGMLKLERELAELERQTEHGELTDLRMIIEEYSRILREALRKIEHGGTVPRNDPEKPNAGDGSQA